MRMVTGRKAGLSRVMVSMVLSLRVQVFVVTSDDQKNRVIVEVALFGTINNSGFKAGGGHGGFHGGTPDGRVVGVEVVVGDVVGAGQQDRIRGGPVDGGGHVQSPWLVRLR